MRIIALVCAALVLAACSTRAGVPATPAVTAAAPASVVGAGTPSVGQAASAWISPSTKSVRIAIGGSSFRYEGPLAVQADGHCDAPQRWVTRTCELVVGQLPECGSCYTATVETYDAIDAATGRIPAGAHLLQAEKDVPFSNVGTGVADFKLQGIPASSAFAPVGKDSPLHGTQSGGFVASKCLKAAPVVKLTALDAGGNPIMEGVPLPSLTSGNLAQLKVQPPASPTSRVFVLLPPVEPLYAFGNSTVHLTARETPGGNLGLPSVNTTIDISYNGDICGVFSEFDAPTDNSKPTGIAGGPDGNLWITETAGNNIARMATTGRATEFHIPNPQSDPLGITSAPGGMWFTEQRGGRIGKITTNGVITATNLIAGSHPEGIALCPEQRLCYNESMQIGSIDYRSGYTGEVQAGGNHPSTPVTAPDGGVWFTLAGENRVCRLDLLTEYITCINLLPDAHPANITLGPDDALWFTEASHKIGRISAAGKLTNEFPVPPGNGPPDLIVKGPDGALWFTRGQYRLGRITTRGTYTSVDIPLSSGPPTGLTVGPDGSLWYTQALSNKILRLR